MIGSCAAILVALACVILSHGEHHREDIHAAPVVEAPKIEHQSAFQLVAIDTRFAGAEWRVRN